MTVEELIREALALDPSSRATMAHELLNSLESLSEPEIEQLWVAEALRRNAQLDNGDAGTVSAEDALANARARRG